MINVVRICDFKGSPSREAILLLSFLFLFIFSGFTQVPSYDWQSKVDLKNVGITNPEDINIAIASGPQNFVYVLTFGSGVQKRNADGSSVSNNFITGLDSPLDIAVDREGLIYIADFQAGGDTFADNGQIKVYNSNGVYQRSILTSYFRPMGIDVDEQYVYIAEYNDGKQGPERTPSSRIRIVDKITGTEVKVNNNVTIPYRITVNSTGKVFVSQAGNSNSSVQIYNEDLVNQGSLANIQSPGSLVVDAFDYLHVVEYAGQVNFEEFIALSTNFDFGDLLQLSHDIYDGIKDNAFSIKVFDPSLNYKFQIKDKIDFPIDLAFNNCDKLYVDNSTVFGTHIENFIAHTFFPSRLEFDLEIYQRTPAFDTEAPVVSCPADITATAEAGNNFAIVTFQDATATDANNFTIKQTGGLSSGSQFPAGETSIVEFTATDICGNESSCTFTITVNPSDEEENNPPVFIDCPSSGIMVNNDPGICGAMVNFATPQVTDDGASFTPERTDNSGLNSGDLFPIGETTITYQADDGVNEPVICSFKVIVNDSEKPKIECPGDINESVAFGESGKIITYGMPTFSDNCGNATITQIAGLASGKEFPVGTTTNTFTVDDGNGNSISCSFKVTITEEEKPFSFECPGDQTNSFDQNCQFELPDFTAALKEEYPEAEFSQTPSPGAIVFQSTDITISGVQNEEQFSCTFFILISDTSKPQINCPADKIATFDPDQGFTVPDYSNELVLSDNCAPTAELSDNVSQSPAPGEVIYDSQQVSFIVNDDAGNTANCSFQLSLEEEDQSQEPEAKCNDTEINLDAEGEAVLVATQVYQGNPEEDNVMLSIDKENFDCSDLGNVNTVTLTVTDRDSGLSSTCTASVRVVDNQPPIVACGEDITEFYLEDGTLKIETSDLNFQASDNCQIAESFVVPNTFTSAGIKTIEIFVRDTSGNENSCVTSIEVLDEEIPFTCKNSLSLALNENNAYTLQPEQLINQSGNLSGYTFSLDRDLLNCEDVGELVPITLNYTSTSNSGSCVVMIDVLDIVYPEFTQCPAEIIEITLDEGETGIVFEIPELMATDNCEVFITQTMGPPAGTELPIGTTNYQFTAKDRTANTATCDFQVKVIGGEEPSEFALDCPQREYVIKADENCGYYVPDFSEILNYTPSNVSIEQSIASGSQITEEVQIFITASFNGETDTCNFTLVPIDNTPPESNCPEDKVVFANEDGTFTIPDYRNELNAADNCGLGEIIQQPAVNTVINEDTVISFLVFDVAGNASSCNFNLSLQIDEPGNDAPIGINDQYQTQINTALEISAGNGVLANDSDPENDYLTAILITDVNFGTLTLNSDGSFNYQPNENFQGEDTFTYVANDGVENSEPILVSILVVENNTGDFECYSEVSFNLDENGEFRAFPASFYSGNGEAYEFEASKLLFTCDDIGVQTITLNYSGPESGSCDIIVNVGDNFDPTLLLRDITLTLDAGGSAVLNIEDIDLGSYDNCNGTVRLSLGKDEFNCKDIGENNVEVTGVDSNGNTATQTITVTVVASEFSCQTAPPNPSGIDYVFVYPNPNSGSFRVYAPAIVSIKQIEVYDHRGRFIRLKSFESTDRNYQMNLGPLQEAVYVLKIVTEKEEIIRRIIIKN
ncbi:HYR domain-containing protein [Gramella sp. AN32]|uniref:HYR domain-containing protein n=1 Tax=Christiangramia antarctica TaxID=2058158 RepID=A0ABW5X7K0_9FLAO|nr:HYR domain-containing protein [Gramella sp. AN32]MCM4157783.1 hypothetical protein [Gramella sp. AN32]